MITAAAVYRDGLWTFPAFAEEAAAFVPPQPHPLIQSVPCHSFIAALAHNR
jgi:hypothetical protein